MSSNIVMANRAQEDDTRLTYSTHGKGQKCTAFQLLKPPTNRVHLGDLGVDGTKKIAGSIKQVQMTGTNRI
jgi:hypothetical protein